jgi:predicted Zn-dependent protease with MMP-like domain
MAGDMVMPNSPDYYALLGLKPDASQEEIHQSFRRLAKMWHPDRYLNAPIALRAQAERRIRQITEAHAILSDPTRRQQYNLERPATRVEHGMPITFGSINNIPGYSSPSRIHASTTNEYGSSIFLGMIFGLITLFALLHATIATDTIGQIISYVIASVFGFISAFCFTQQQSVYEWMKIPQQGPRVANAAYKRPNTADTLHENNTDPDSLAAFELLVEEALADLPPSFDERLENLAIFVESEPGIALLRRLNAEPGTLLLGLYEGIPLTKQLATERQSTPERITLYEGPIERYCAMTGKDIVEQIQATLLHELAHHFGIDHDEMPIWVKA